METLTLKSKGNSGLVLERTDTLAVAENINLVSNNPLDNLSKYFEILHKHIIQPRASRYSPAPNTLHPKILAHLNAQASELYEHQASALFMLLKRNNVLLATKTASGKSLVFMYFAIDKLLKNPQSKVLVLYPVRALIEDQLERWTQLCRDFGLQVGFLHGQVESEERLQVLSSSQILLCTPDILHFWLMPNLHLKVVSDWLTAISFIVIDEAHTFSGVFGTNVSFLLKRIESFAKNTQYFASTATIDGAADYLQQLTGRSFVEVGKREDGSPAYPKEIVFVKAKNASAPIQLLMAAISNGNKFMFFKNSRQGIEQKLATLLQGEHGSSIRPQIQDGYVCTYRGGYEALDRAAILKFLRLGRLKGVLCTSALEVGLDIGDIDLVIIDDLSPNINSFWQRVGRAGRKGPALIIQILPKDTLLEPKAYLQSKLLKPTLYPKLEFFGKWHHDCLMQEQDVFKTRSAPKHKVQFRHSFRNVGASFQLGLDQRDNLNLGGLDYEQYLNEAYPGAIYRYLGRPHRVGWRSKDFIKCYGTGNIEVFAEEIRFSLLKREHISDGYSCFLTKAQTVRAIIGFSQFGRSYFYNTKSSWSKKPIFKLYDSDALVVKVDDEKWPNAEQLEELMKIFATLASFDKNDIIYHLDSQHSALIIQASIAETGLIQQVLWPQKEILLGLLNKILVANQPHVEKDTLFYVKNHRIDPVMANIVKGAEYGFYVDEKEGRYLFLPFRGTNAEGQYELITGLAANRLIGPKYFRPVYEQPSPKIANIMLYGYNNNNDFEPSLVDQRQIPNVEKFGKYDGVEHSLSLVCARHITLIYIFRSCDSSCSYTRTRHMHENHTFINIQCGNFSVWQYD